MTEIRSLTQDAPGSTYAPKYTPGKGLTDAQTGEAIQYSDAPNYNPATSNFTPNAPVANAPAATATSQPVAPASAAQSPTATSPATSASAGMVPYNQALANVPQRNDSATIKEDLAKAYGMAHQQLQQSGQPNALGANRATIQNAVSQNTQESQQTDPVVDNFYATNPFIKQTNDQLMEFLNPKNTSDTLQTFVDAYASDRAELAGLKTELMNNKRVMGGTENDLRDEITKAAGFATESQVQALTLGRNKALIARSAQLTDLISTQQDAISTDVQMLGMAKDMANTQFNQRMSIMNYQQENTKFMYTAAQDQFKTNLNLLGADGLYKSMQSNPNMISYYEKLNNLPSGSLAIAANTAATDRANKLADDALSRQVKLSSLETDKAQRANIYSQISERNSNAVASNNLKNFITPPTINPTTGKADPRSLLASVMQTKGLKTDDKLKLTGAVVSAVQAMAERNSNGKFVGLGFGQIVPGFLTNNDQTANRQDLSSLEGTVENWMTGASVSDDQQKRIKRDMIPKRGDADWTTRNKLNALTNYMLNYAGGNLATQGINFNPQPVDFFSNPLVTAPDGQQIIITN